jgi:SAM-dependent methyltransferase
MPDTSSSPGAADIQQRYYRETAIAYDAMHAHADDGHDVALRFISALIAEHRIRSILDVGCGTGRALRHFRERHPAVPARGVEPTTALIQRALEVHGVAPGQIACGRGESLPYGDKAFDAVCELGILHHVPDPNAVVREMLRVARHAVFISDANRFGQGSWLGRIAKLALYQLRLWPLVNYLKTGGRGYVISAGDGLAYSYSVFDSYDLLAGWASQVILVPTHPPSAMSWAHPLLTSGQVLACAIRD